MARIVKWLSLKQPEKQRVLGLETEAEYRARWISIRVLYFTGFVMFLAFGIVATGVWPYLKSVMSCVLSDGRKISDYMISVTVGSIYE